MSSVRIYTYVPLDKMAFPAGTLEMGDFGIWESIIWIICVRFCSCEMLGVDIDWERLFWKKASNHGWRVLLLFILCFCCFPVGPLTLRKTSSKTPPEKWLRNYFPYGAKTLLLRDGKRLVSVTGSKLPCSSHKLQKKWSHFLKQYGPGQIWMEKHMGVSFKWWYPQIIHFFLGFPL